MKFSSHSCARMSRTLASTAMSLLGIFALVFVAGCETDSYMNPSVTGYFENTPTTLPVLRRIDVIEPPEEPLGVTGPPEPQDLLANSLQYRLSPGDEIGIEIYELISLGKTERDLRVVDQAGYIRLPIIDEVKAGGLTLGELRDSIRAKLEVHIKNPDVTVDIQKGRSFEFSIQGAIQNAGLFALNKPDFRLTQAIALAGGADVVTERVLIIRAMRIEEDSTPNPDESSSERSSPSVPTDVGVAPSAQPAPANTGQGTTATPVDIESLINKLSEGDRPPVPVPPVPPPSVPPSAPAPETVPPSAPAPSPGAVSGTQSAPQGTAAIDIDTLEPVSVIDQPTVSAKTGTQQVPKSQLSNEGDSFIFDVNTQQWVRLRGANAAKPPVAVSDPTAPVPPGAAVTGGAAHAIGQTSPAVRAARDPKAIFQTRIIVVDYERLVQGDQSQNVVIRPGDDIYLQFPPIGVVYIDGEISRSGVFQLPSYGRLTLSRLVAAAGGLTEIAIPERVDLIRRLPGDRQAAIRINLAAIRNMGEPDIDLKRDDHVIIGTNFWATPLAVFRNGLRITYGFGFLLDRNFGNDVFGPPPDNFTIN